MSFRKKMMPNSVVNYLFMENLMSNTENIIPFRQNNYTFGEHIKHK